MNSTNIYIQRLLDANPLREPVMQSIITSLQLPPGSCGLDAGCGIGQQACLLAQAVGQDGRIVGVDLDSGLLAYAEEYARDAGYGERVEFKQGDVSHLPFDDHAFDFVWSADCIGYPSGELAQVLCELLRVVKPGGEIFLSGWSSQQLLSGYPILEARLNSTCSGYIPYFAGKNPEHHFMRALSAFHEAGLEDVRAQTFVRDIQTPLHPSERAGLASLFEMLWGQQQPGCSPEDWEDYQRLCRPESPDFILDLPDYYGFFTISVFRGKTPRN